MDSDDLKDELHPLMHLVGVPEVSLAIKIYGIDDEGEVIKESMVLF